MTIPNDKACREAFEKWAVDMDYGSFSIGKHPNGKYASSHTYLMWLAWQAAWNERATMRESGEVPDIDVEIAIAEAIQLIPARTTYEDKGSPVLHYLKKHGYRVFKHDDGESNG